MAELELVAGPALERIRPRLAALGREPSPADVADALRAERLVVSDQSVLGVVAALRREAYGAGPLTQLLQLPGVTDVLVNGPDEVFVDCGQGVEPTDVRFANDQEVRRLATRLAAGVGRRLDDASPYVDARLADGTRFHAVLAPVAQPGTTISLRIPARVSLSLDDWVRLGSMPTPIATVLSRLIERKLAFLVSGGTGTGKTTLLSSLLAEVPGSERIVIVEDSRELAPRHPHVVWLEGRPPNAEGVGAISLSTLVKQSLRMRPDRVVVGEVRGGEVVDLLAALNTGHEGGCGTVHANSARDVPARLEALAALAGMGRDALHAQLASALSVVVHIRRGPDGLRRVSELAALRRTGTGYVEAVPALAWVDGRLKRGPGAAVLEEVLA